MGKQGKFAEGEWVLALGRCAGNSGMNWQMEGESVIDDSQRFYFRHELLSGCISGNWP